MVRSFKIFFIPSCFVLCYIFISENSRSESSSLPKYWLFRVRLMGIQYSIQFLTNEGAFIKQNNFKQFPLQGVLLGSLKEAQAHLVECGDPRTLDATLLKNEADLSPEIMLKIINNKVKKAEEGEESKKRKKSKDLDDLNRNNESKSDEKRNAAPAENSAITSKECDVTMGSCPFAQVRMKF